ncbi:MAG: penicillin acylase family protein, partial [Acidimicrobiales bacterium]
MNIPKGRVVLAVGIMAAALAGCSSNPGAVKHADSVTITRDSAGIPHITAANFHALGYGEGLAFSRDNFCTLAQDFVTVNG